MNVDEIKRTVLRREKPLKEDYERAEEVFRLMKERGLRILREQGIEDADIMLVGSIAKDTWLRDDKDMDIFVLFPPSIKKEDLKIIGLRVAKSMAVEGYEEKYAEHPYVETTYMGFRIDIVPCFKVKSPKEIISAVDRTPFHTEYIRRRLRPYQKDEVRILKRFLKGIGAYGAEVKVEGFSGYLTELLIIAYGSFEKVIKMVAKWRPWRVVIDVEGHHEDKGKVIKQFKTPLIVVDPVDPRRNAAAAVSLQKMSEFIAAAQQFLLKPSLVFFYPPQQVPLASGELSAILKRSGTHIIAVRIRHPPMIPDILWGELKRTFRGLWNLLDNGGFIVRDGHIWSDEEALSILLFELERVELPRMEVHRGPHVYDRENALKFIKKYRGMGDRCIGPYIKNGRWYVYREREHSYVKDFIVARIRSTRLGKDIRELIGRGVEVYVDEEINMLLDNVEFSRELRKFLKKKPIWMVEHEDKGQGRVLT